jgi:hypothetical protein
VPGSPTKRSPKRPFQSRIHPTRLLDKSEGRPIPVPGFTPSGVRP